MEIIKELPKVFEEFAEARQNAFINVKKVKEQGIPVIGSYCTYFPVELATAAGAASVGLCSTSGETIAEAEIFESCFAIPECESYGLRNPTVVAAQAANELLSVMGVKASFVLTDYNDQIYISARAIDEINVQLIMEALGGGGHQTMAAVQLKDVSLQEAKEQLVNVLKDVNILK